MNLMREHAIDRIRQDHQLLADLVYRITQACQSSTAENCERCSPAIHRTCEGNLGELIRNLIGVTLKHSAIELLLMKDHVPLDHFNAHQRDHDDIVSRLIDVRNALSYDGNCISTIRDVGGLLEMIENHAKSFDKALESYLNVDLQGETGHPAAVPAVQVVASPA